MQVARWGEGFAVLLSKKVAEQKELRDGDEVDFTDLQKRAPASEQKDAKAAFVKAMEQFRWPAPADYKFDRDEANER